MRYYYTTPGYNSRQSQQNPAGYDAPSTRTSEVPSTLLPPPSPQHQHPISKRLTVEEHFTRAKSATIIQNAFRKHNAKKARLFFDDYKSIIKIEENIFLISTGKCSVSTTSGVLSKNILEFKRDTNILPYFSYKKTHSLSETDKVELAIISSANQAYYICTNVETCMKQACYQANYCGMLGIHDFNLYGLNFIGLSAEDNSIYNGMKYMKSKYPSIYVSEDFRRCGIGKAALNYFINSITTPISFVAKYNISSQKTHEAAGFTCIGLVKSSTNSPREDMDVFIRNYSRPEVRLSK